MTPNAEVQRIIREALGIQNRHEPVTWLPEICRCGGEYPCDARLMADDTLQRHKDPDLLLLVRELAARQARPEKPPPGVELRAIGTRHSGSQPPTRGGRLGLDPRHVGDAIGDVPGPYTSVGGMALKSPPPTEA